MPTTRIAHFGRTRNGLLDGTKMEVRGDVIEASGERKRRYPVKFLTGMLAGCTSVVDEEDLVFEYNGSRGDE